MTTAYTSLLGLALPVTGELSGTWGTVVNDSITSLLDTSVAGTTNVSTDTDVTLTTTTGAANTARQAILLFSGARTALRTVTAPAQSKIYTVINATTGGFAVKLVGSGPTTGLTIPNGASATVAWNGSDFIEVGAGSIGNLVVNGTLTVTGATTLQSTLAVTGNITNTAGTANGVAYLNGSKVVTSGSALTFDGANVLTLFRTTATEALEPTIKFSNLTFAGQNPGVVKSSNGGLALDIQSPSDSTFQLRSRIYMNGGSGDSISFQASSNNGSTYGERMVLTSTGLGIGTSSPDQALVVNKASGSTYVKVSGANNVNNDLALHFTDGTNNAYFGMMRGTSGGIAGALHSYTGGAIRSTLDSSGNLGLGVTPSGWNSSRLALQIGGANGGYVTADNGLAIASNYAFVSGDKFVANGYAPLYFMSKSAGSHQWFISGNNASGAGAAWTPTQAMTLDASGNLGLGETSPSAIASGFTTMLIKGANGGGIRCGTTNQFYIYSDSTNAFINQTANGYMAFATNNTERARIDSVGTFLLGSTNSNTGIDTGSTRMFVVAPNSNFGAALTTVGDNQGRGIRFTDQPKVVIGVADAGFDKITFGSNSAHPLTFITSGQEKARIDTSGNLLVGLTTAAAGSASTVYKNQDSTWTWRVESGATSLPNGILVKYSGTSPNNTGSQFIYCQDSGDAERMSVRSNGGIANYSGNNVNLSDRREKTNFAPAGSYLDKICAIPVQTFNYIDQNLEEDGGLTLGVVAQDVQAVAPELVMESNWGSKEDPKMRLSIYQTDLQYALMKCIQEQQAIIQSLKARLDAANL